MDEARRGARSGDGGSDWLPMVGGAAAVLLAVGYLATMPLFAAVGAPPVGAEARLAYHAAAGGAWWGIVGLSVATDLLFVPLAIALHQSLRRVDRSAAHLAAAFIALFVVLDLAVTWPAYAALITLGDAYAGATAEADRALLVTAAGYPSAVLGSPLQAIDSVLTLSIGILIGGVVMVRRRDALDRPFGRATAASAVATGIIGIASVMQTAVTGSVSPLVIVVSLLTIVWLLLLGRDLLRTARGGFGRA